MKDPDQPADDFQPDEEDLQSIEISLSADFLRMFRKRGVEPGVMAQRLVDLGSEVAADAQQLFPDWEQLTHEERSRFLLTGATARINLELSPPGERQ